MNNAGQVTARVHEPKLHCPAQSMEGAMDIICLNCGEPWDVYHIYHDAEPEDFERRGCVIKRCPCCRANEPEKYPKKYRELLAAWADAAELFGDDLDGFAAFLDDMKLFTLE